jgi:hypothetical protein
MTDGPPEALRRLEQRLAQASEAAERLVVEAARTAWRERPPPQGWQAPASEDPPPGDRRGTELEVLLGAIHMLRDLVPAEFIERLAAAVRELLLAVRALIDFYVERLERPRPDHGEVRDIPID